MKYSARDILGKSKFVLFILERFLKVDMDKWTIVRNAQQFENEMRLGSDYTIAYKTNV